MTLIPSDATPQTWQPKVSYHSTGLDFHSQLTQIELFDAFTVWADINEVSKWVLAELAQYAIGVLNMPIEQVAIQFDKGAGTIRNWMTTLRRFPDRDGRILPFSHHVTIVSRSDAEIDILLTWCGVFKEASIKDKYPTITELKDYISTVLDGDTTIRWEHIKTELSPDGEYRFITERQVKVNQEA